jgi:rubredoxin
MTEKFCCSDCNHVLDEIKDAERCSNCGASWEDESEIRCPKCNDLLDLTHKLKHCAKCSQLLVHRALKENPPFISQPIVALLISILSGVLFIVLIVNILGLLGRKGGGDSSVIGGACVSGIIAGDFGAGASIYKSLIAMGSDVMEDKE